MAPSIPSRLRRLAGDLHYARNLREHQLATYLLPEEKRERLAAFAGRAPTFVETGTYLGETTLAMAAHYGTVHTIELHRELYEKAAARFADHPSIHCHHGDSATVLPRILEQLDGPAVFWLDAHFSGDHTARAKAGDSPIEREVKLILDHDRRAHVILIDDARLFIGRRSYPTMGELHHFVTAHSDYRLTVRDDIIRIAYEPEWGPGKPSSLDEA